MSGEGSEQETWRSVVLWFVREIAQVLLFVGFWFFMAWLLAGCPV